MAGIENYSLRSHYDVKEGNSWYTRQPPNWYPTPNDEYDFPHETIPVIREIPAQSDEDVALKKYVGTGVGLVSLMAESLLSHPFVVLRRQCQVHNNSCKYHLIPITLVPVICHLHHHQGLTTLWKGLGSVLLIRGLSLGVEDLISKVTPWPKEITWHSSLKSFFQHTFLKCISLAVITPFYSASLVETVQSDIASEKPGILDVFREGGMRLFNVGGGSRGRMLPIWALVLPTVTLGIARYFFSLVVKNSSTHIMQVRQKRKQESTGALPKDLSSMNMMQDIELTASLISIISADVVLYPFETILHRLHLQGTRTIIDNLDTGKSVLPILTNYEGPVDCYESCLGGEGFFGLYKGFGALILQYAAHITVVHITRFVLTEITNFLKKPPKPPATFPPSIPPMVQEQRYLIS